VTLDHAVEPVQLSARVSLAQGAAFAEQTVYTVPAGKRLIVEFVSVSCAFTSDYIVRAEVRVAASTAFLPLSQLRRGFAATAAEKVTLYADAGQTVVVRYRENNAGVPGTRNADFTVVGRLVDALVAPPTGEPAPPPGPSFE
jgi:hypothetical protein